MTIRHKKTGQVYVINYIYRYIAPSFEKQVKADPKWKCPRGSCSSGKK